MIELVYLCGTYVVGKMSKNVINLCWRVRNYETVLVLMHIGKDIHFFDKKGKISTCMLKEQS